MEYMGNEEYWDKKFEIRSDAPLDPEKSLEDNIGWFKQGSVLDVACGDGRNTLFLLEKGFEVTGIDFSVKALERLHRFAARKNYRVTTKQVDLAKNNGLNDIGVFDNVVVNHYRLSKEQVKCMDKHISDGGILFICGFGHKHKVDFKIRKEDLIQSRDFNVLKEFFDLITYNENEDERGFFVTYIFRKNMKFKLMRPDETMEERYYDFANEWIRGNQEIVPYSARLLHMDYKSWLEQTYRSENKETCLKEFVPGNTYFLVSEHGKIIGAVNIRHYLNEYLLRCGGHIGYGIRPSERRKGYASLMLELALPIAKELGIEKALITCDKDNVGSAKTIINNGGVLENEIEDDGKVVQRYWVDI